MVEISIGTLFIIIGLVLLNGFFVASEFALVRVRATRIQELIDHGSKRAKRVQQITKDLNRTTSSAQLGITLSSIMLGFLGEAFFSEIIIGIIHAFNGEISGDGERIVSIFAFFAGYFIITYMHVTFGELIPKVMSIQYTEKVAMACSEPMWWFMRFTSPLLNFFIWSANGVIGLFGIPISQETHSQDYSEEELKIIISDSIARGEIEEYESKLIFNVLNLTDKVAKELITPRIDIKALPSTASKNDILKLAKTTGYSRIPIYGETLDDMLGFIHVKDLLTLYLPEAGNENGDFHLDQIIRKTLVVHEGKKVDNLLVEMQNEQIQVAIVVDEYGSVEGLITIEDIIEELIGNIQDEFDEAILHDNIKVNDHSVIVGGLVSIETFNKTSESKFDKTIEASDSVTLAGYVLELFGSEIPEEGEETNDGVLNYKIKQLSGNRIEIVEVTKVNGQKPN